MEKKLIEKLDACDKLIFLFTSSSRGNDWNWPFFEIGYFSARHSGDQSHIYYFFVKGNNPLPLTHIQGIRIDDGSNKALEEFIRNFYTSKDGSGVMSALKPDITQLEIAAKVAAIAEAFVTATSLPIYPTYRVVLQAPKNMEEQSHGSKNCIPENYQVASMTPGALSIFALAEQPSTWKYIKRSIEDETGWIDDLDEQYARALKNKIAYPTKSTFYSPDRGSQYRAMVTRIEIAAVRVKRISITFVPELASTRIGGPAFNLLRFATRVRTEIIERFQGKLHKLSEALGSQESALRALRSSIKAIRIEAEALGYVDPKQIQQVFGSENSDREHIKEIFEEWDACSENLNFDDLINIEDSLAKLKKLNEQFLVMISRRHLELMEGDTNLSVARDERAGASQTL